MMHNYSSSIASLPFPVKQNRAVAYARDSGQDPPRSPRLLGIPRGLRFCWRRYNNRAPFLVRTPVPLFSDGRKKKFLLDSSSLASYCEKQFA